eukprot:TRINITY_DN1616_c0_g1_i15.p1 TRINITY_DN1616_c0_g1~~TRINITY_DN1616_c0_g1_i15.p1  ORF type:complete len:382 (+),score=63.05 TRINITY_DN1616_c0_g1_i15:245-1390(+)
MERYQGEQNLLPKFCIYCSLILVGLGALALIPMVIFSQEEFGFTTFLTTPVNDDEIAIEFKKFTHEYGKLYSNYKERERRRAIFARNYRRIVAFNRQDHSWKLGVNQFADLSDKEFQELYLSDPEPTGMKYYESLKRKESDGPEIDWEKKLPPAKDQGNCGSCWTFASVGGAEAIYAIRHNTEPIKFSEQQLVDCCKGNYSDGCRGGERYQGFNCISNVGIAKAEDYPYKAYDGKCYQDKVKKVFKLNGYLNITRNSNDELKGNLTDSPITVGVNASPFAFRFYKKGVISGSCPADQVNHAVLLIGFGNDKDSKLDYWKVRNSWGKNWGLQGHVLIKRDTGISPGVCAIAYKGCKPVYNPCLLYTSPSPRDLSTSRMPSSA